PARSQTRTRDGSLGRIPMPPRLSSHVCVALRVSRHPEHPPFASRSRDPPDAVTRLPHPSADWCTVVICMPNTKKYNGYRSFPYLQEGVDYQPFKLAREVQRVTSSRVEVTPDQEERARRMMSDNLVISLHDHAFVVPEDPNEIWEYRRAGRDWTGYEGLSVS